MDVKPPELKPWGRFAALGLGFVAMLAGQLVALFALAWWLDAPLAGMPDFSGDGVAIALIIFISTPVQFFLLAAFAQRRGGNFLAYLGLTLPRRSEVVFGVIVIAVFIIIGDALTWLLGNDIVTPFQNDIYRTAAEAGFLPLLLLLIAVVVLTPIGEETLFRGFLFRGWLQQPRDAWAVIVITALLWSIIHVQYDWFVISQIFVSGLLLGWIRWATGSTILTILLHALINTEGMLETFVAQKWLS
ncbi:MAG TPA: CPBP family intramembrane glutamic endopeptidase [Pseudolabrys sp.]